MDLVTFVLIVCGGIVAGVFGALLGLGGGVLLIPFLVLIVDVPMHQAIATSIIAIIATSSAGAAINLEKHIVNMRLGMLLEIATVMGAIFGGITANYFSSTVLTKLFSVLLLIIAIIMSFKLFKKENHDEVYKDGILGSTFKDDSSGQIISYTVKNVPLSMFVSLIAGNVSGLLGIGGGVFKVPAMHILSKVPMKAATATSNFMIGVTAAASAFIYFAHGHLNPFIASSAALGVFAGSTIGIKISRRIHSNTLTYIFILALLGISIQLFFRR